MKCQEVMELMQRQLDDDLEGHELEQLMQHTEHCPDCSAMFERLKQLSAELTALPKVMPAYSLVDAILPELERIDREYAAKLAESGSSESVGAAVSRRRQKRRFSWGAFGTIVAAGAAVGIFLALFPPNLKQLGEADTSPLAAELSGAAKSMQLENGNHSFDDFAAADLDSEGSIAMPDALRTKEDGLREPGGDFPQIREETAPSQPEVQFTSSGGGQAEPDQAPSQTSNSVPEQPASSEESVPEKSLTGGETAEIWVKDQSGENMEKEPEQELGREPLARPEFVPLHMEGVPSPDGRYHAFVNQHSVNIVDAESGEVLMASIRKNGQHSGLQWSEDGAALVYEVHLQQGAIETYVVDISGWTESKQSP